MGMGTKMAAGGQNSKSVYGHGNGVEELKPAAERTYGRTLPIPLRPCPYFSDTLKNDFEFRSPLRIRKAAVGALARDN